ncbi:hypothetical protein ACVWZR_005928 [Bradyrhizobium sp. i1.3.1]
MRIVMKSIDHLGQEFFRFEMATAVAGSILGINPFDQPDVEAAKIKTRELTASFEKTGALPAEQPVVSTDEADLYTDEANATALRAAGANGDLTSWLKAHLSRSGRGDYVALLGYIARDKATIDALQTMRLEVREKRHVATCAEFGPALPAFDRAGLQGRARQRRVSPDHGRRCQGLVGAGPEGELRRDQGRAGARRLRRAHRARPARAPGPPQGRAQERSRGAQRGA